MDLTEILRERARRSGRFQAAEGVKRAIRETIVAHGIGANAPLPAEREISALFNVSRNTARKALAELVDDHIIYRVHGKGTFVAGLSAEGTSRTALTIGVIFPKLSMAGDIDEERSPSHYQMLAGVEEVAAKRGYALSALGRQADIPALTEYLAELPVDGLLVLDIRGEDRALLERFRCSGKPMVVVSPGALFDDLNMVAFDQPRTGYRVARYLIRAGRKKIFWGYAPSDPVGQTRLSGYEKATRERGLPSYAIALYPDADPGWLRRPVPEAVVQRILGEADAFVSDDVRARQVMEAAIAAGLRVPEDLAIFGYFNRAFCRDLAPMLSSVNPPLKELGAAAVGLLEKAIADPKRPPEHVLVETELVIRTSSE